MMILKVTSFLEGHENNTIGTYRINPTDLRKCLIQRACRAFFFSFFLLFYFYFSKKKKKKSCAEALLPCFAGEPWAPLTTILWQVLLRFRLQPAPFSQWSMHHHTDLPPWQPQSHHTIYAVCRISIGATSSTLVPPHLPHCRFLPPPTDNNVATYWPSLATVHCPESAAQPHCLHPDLFRT